MQTLNLKCRFFCLVSLLLLGLGGCEDFPSEYPEYQPFFQLSRTQQETAIFEYPLDEQIDLMILAWTDGPRPPMFLFSFVAKNGEKIVPLLIQRLQDSDDMKTLRPLVRCLYDVNRWHFEWTKHQNYVEMFEKAIGEKSDPVIQREVRAILETGKLHPFFKGLKHGKKVDD